MTWVMHSATQVLLQNILSVKPKYRNLFFFIIHYGEDSIMGDVILFFLLLMMVAYAFWDDIFTE